MIERAGLVATLLAMIAIVVLLCLDGHAGECAPRKLNAGEALDHECKLFRVVRDHGDRYIEIRGKRVEKIDCSKAVDEFGVLVYHAHAVAADFYCPTSARRP